MNIEIIHHRIRSFDGTSIRYQAFGSGSALVLSNCLGGSYQLYEKIYQRLSQTYRIISWDYRGMPQSPCERKNALTIENHSRDLAAILEHEKIKHAVLIGWSMGVQVNFEFYRQNSHAVAGMIGLHGTYAQPFRTALPSRYINKLVPSLLQLSRKSLSPASKIIQQTSNAQLIKRIFQVLGLLSWNVDKKQFDHLITLFRTVNFQSYIKMLENLGQHTAKDLLSSIDKPTLFVAGTCDVITPAHLFRHIDEQIADALFVEIPKATHYGPIEYPDQYRSLISDFLATDHPALMSWRNNIDRSQTIAIS